MTQKEFWENVQRALGIPEPDVDGLPGPQTYGALGQATSVEIVFGYEPPELIVIEGELPWLTIATEYIGTEEMPGPDTHPRVLKWWKLIHQDYESDETPWCAAYVGGVLEEVGITSTRSAWARNYQHWGQACNPTLGAIAVFRRGSGGHVGFVMGVDANGNLMILGGNQRDAVNISAFPRTRLIATRWPAGYAVPENVYLPEL